MSDIVERLATDTRWRLANETELPKRFTDPAIDDFQYVCSNGWEGSVSIGSAFIHKPHRWPQCFPGGPESKAVCTCVLLKKEPAHD